MFRSHTCGELRLSDAGKSVTLAGWVQRARKMIKEGKSAEEIKARWKDDVEKFKVQRKPYLLYEE